MEGDSKDADDDLVTEIRSRTLAISGFSRLTFATSRLPVVEEGRSDREDVDLQFEPLGLEFTDILVNEDSGLKLEVVKVS